MSTEQVTYMNKKGQALIELTIAIAVIALVIVGLFQGLNVGIMGTYRVDVSNTALHLAQSQMESIKSEDYQVYNDEGDPDGDAYDKIDEPNGFTIGIAVSNIAGENPEEKLQQITVTVTFDEDRTITVAGYKTDW